MPQVNIPDVGFVGRLTDADRAIRLAFCHCWGNSEMERSMSLRSSARMDADKSIFGFVMKTTIGYSH